MGGQGSFSDLRPPINLTIIQKPDRITRKLPALLDYQLSLAAPVPPGGSFNAAAARRGERLFHGKAQCATCHMPPTYTDVSSGPDPSVPFLHDPAEVGTEPFYAARTATGKYRTSPLRGIWQHPPYFHDGSAANLLAVVNHYDQRFALHLSPSQKADLVEFLKSL
jgi:cytochrome c peroxidase